MAAGLFGRDVLRICAGLLLMVLSGAAQSAMDADLDTLPDAFEQQLLERFLPRFHVGKDDCDVQPSRFQPGSEAPTAIARDGVIYGQAFPLPGTGEGQYRIELHYYHLWSQDCGRLAHPLDVERVSTLIESPTKTEDPAAWRAEYWYASAHEDTVCDVSHGAHAGALDAEDRGAGVWISRNKHASYLSKKRCKLGCGGDVCKEMRELDVPEVINIGEAGRPLNGAVWTASSAWPFAAKLRPDFDAATIAQFEGGNPKKIFAVNQGVPPVRATILAGNETLDGVATGGRHTGSALGTGKRATEGALGKAFRAVGRFLSGGDKAQQTAAKDEQTAAESPVRQ